MVVVVVIAAAAVVVLMVPHAMSSYDTFFVLGYSLFVFYFPVWYMPLDQRTHAYSAAARISSARDEPKQETNAFDRGTEPDATPGDGDGGSGGGGGGGCRRP